MFFRKKGMPEIDEAVQCTVKRIMPHCVFVTLDEYENIEAMLHISEVSTKWVKNIREFVSENKVVVCKVLKTDRNEIDVSLKRVSAGERKRKLDDIKNELRMEKLIEFVGKKLGEEPKQALAATGKKIIETYSTLHDFYDAVKEEGVQVVDTLGLPQKWQDSLKEQISEQLKAQRVELKKIVVINSFLPEGVEIIKKLFKKMKEIGAVKDTEISVKYVSAPKYAIALRGENYKLLEGIMKKIMAEIQEAADRNEIEAEKVSE